MPPDRGWWRRIWRHAISWAKIQGWESGRHWRISSIVEDTEAVHALLQHVRAVGRPDSVHARLTGGRGDAVVSAMPFRQDGASLFLIRLSSRQAEPVDAPPKLNAKLLKSLENAPDGIVATDRPATS